MKGELIMNKIAKITTVLILILVVGAVIALKESKRARSEIKIPDDPVEKVAITEIEKVAVAEIEKVSITEIEAVETPKSEEVKTLPLLVDLGADECAPCKMMAPILEELKKEYTGIFDVVFYDVWKKPDAGKKYGIRMIPTQIFFNAAGKELFRHEGFFSREDILSKWKELSVDIEKKQE